MSTKTTFKRIALVAVAALGFGVMPVAPSNAAVNTPSLTLAASTGTTVVNTAATVSASIGFLAGVIGDSVTTTVTLTSAPTGNTALPVWSSTAGTLVGATETGANTQSLVTTSTATAVSNTHLITLTPAVAGVYVVTVTQGTLSATWTLTATAIGAVTAANSTSFLNAGETVAAVADEVVAVPKAANAAAQAATIVVTAKNAVPTDLTATTILSATISGPGTLGFGGGAGPAVASIVSQGRAVTGLAGENLIGVFSDGTAGVATITISAGSTVLATETVSFSDAASAYKVDSTTPTTVVTALGVADTQAWNLSTVDAAGILVSAAPTIFAVSSDTTIMTVGVVGDVVTVTGVKAGTATFTVCNTAACASPTITLGPVSVTVRNKTASAATLTLDKSEYATGEAFTLTISASDSAGVLADGSFAAMATLTTSVLVPNTAGGILGGALTPVFTDGKATVKGFMPASTGPVTFTLTLGAKGTPGVADAAAGAVITATAGVSSAAVDAATAATDAAAEATDAANAATDAANAAAEAADAATAAAQDAADAVAALSVQVSEMVDALKKQITALTNLVIKIQKKVKA